MTDDLDDGLYEQVWTELEEGSLNRGLWARCYAEADGDTEKAKARYLKARVAQLQGAAEKDRVQEMERLREKQRVDRDAQEKRRADAEAEARRSREQHEREEAEREEQARAERAKDERRRGVHGREGQEEQEEADFLEIIQTVRRRVASGGFQIEGEKIDHWGCTRLIRAAQQGNYEAILQMIADGDDPSVQDSSGMPARAHSEVRSFDKCARFLDVAERVWEKKGVI